MKKKNSFKRKGLLLACACAVSMSMFSRHSASAATEVSDEVVVAASAVGGVQQQADMVALRGTVTDNEGAPLPGVNIYLKSDKTVGTVTDANGKFAIAVPVRNNDVLIFTFIGMKDHEVRVSQRMSRVLNVEMQSNELVLEEVVVTGIFNKAKESYTGAAISISTEEIQKAGNRNLISSIQNIDPSFNIAVNNLMGSDPNSLPSITIRGTSSLTSSVRDLQEDNKNMRDANQPLYVLDGFEISLARFYDLDENQIEDITILKDNSATAMYGSRGANGVVVITSKRPPVGKLNITYRGNLSIEASDLSSYNLMNAHEKLDFEKVAGLYDSPNAIFDQDLKNHYTQRRINALRGVDTYWLSYPVRVGVGQRHSVRLEGGDQAIRYAGSLSYNNVMGTMKGAERNTFIGGVFLQYRSGNFTFQNDLQVSQNHAINSPYGSFNTYTRLNSYFTPYDEDGNLIRVLEDYRYRSLEQVNRVFNPLYNALLPQRNDSEYQNITNNFMAEWRINKDLFFRGRLSITSNHNRSDVYVSAKDTSFDGYVGDDYDRKGSYTFTTGESSSYEGDLTMNYSKLIADKHQVFVGLGYNIGENLSESYSIMAEGITNINMDFLGMANQYYKDSSPTGTESISRRVGTVFTGNYTFDKRYFLDISARYEGSSRFGSKQRFAPFWSSGIGWNLHHEGFLKESKVVDIARLRMSYGTSGSQNFSPYQALTTYRSFVGSNYRSWYGVYMLGLGNDELKWQTTDQVNVGTEIELFDRRFRVNFDVYDKVTDNLLSDVNLPTASGFNSYKANVGKVSNRGFETIVNLFLIRDRQRDLSWSIGGSMMHNKNEILEISNSLKYLNEQLKKESGINPSFLFEEGQSFNTIFAVKSKGIDPSNGKEVFIKHDGTETYTWSSDDQVACGVNEPKIQGGLNTSFRLKGVTFNAYFNYRYGGQIYNSTLVSKVENVSPYDNVDRRALYDRWQKPGDVAIFKSVKDRTTTYATSRFVMDENTLECGTLSLGYEVPAAWLKKHNLPIQYLSITGYSEKTFYISSVQQERGYFYPFARNFSFALTARF